MSKVAEKTKQETRPTSTTRTVSYGGAEFAIKQDVRPEGKHEPVQLASLPSGRKFQFVLQVTGRPKELSRAEPRVEPSEAD